MSVAPTAGPLNCRPDGVAAGVFVVVAEELGTDPVIVVAGPGSLVCPALLVQGEGGAGQLPLARQGEVCVGGEVVEALSCGRGEEMFYLFDGAV